MHKVKHLCFLLTLTCCVLGQKKYVLQKKIGYEAHSSNDEESHYQSNHYEYEHKPYPYRFGYDIKDEKGNAQYHKEEGDEHNVKKGSYGYTDAYGIYRQVDYIADHMGFRAKIRTNEPGTANYHPAHVSIYSEPPPSHIHDNYNAYHQPAHQQQQPQHVSYDDSPDHDDDYQKTTQPVYHDEPDNEDLVKPAYSSVQKHQSSHEEQHYPRLDHKKYTYVPVYVSNKIDYKN